MSDEEKKQNQPPELPPEITPDVHPAVAPEVPAAPEKDPKAPLSDRKKNALLRYMAVLFGVAFLLVALSFLIQIRDSSVTISQLNQSNASALQNAEKLQTENRDLTAENKRLNNELHDAELALDEATYTITAQESTIENQEKEQELAAAAAQKQMDAMAFLSHAAQMRLADDKTKCQDSLAEIPEPELLEKNAKALYDELKSWVGIDPPSSTEDQA